MVYAESFPLLDLVDKLYDSIMPTRCNPEPTVAQILSASDESFRKGSINTATAELVLDSPAPDLLVEIEHLRQENECMKVHLSTELEKLRAENEQLHTQLRELARLHTTSHHSSPSPSSSNHPSISHSSSPDPPHSSSSNQPPLSSSEKQSSQPNLWDLEDAVIKAFNSLPKDISAFYRQMKEGVEKIDKFSELPEESLFMLSYINMKELTVLRIF